MSELLDKARMYGGQQMKEISEEERPLFHLTGDVGWINDPNGFSAFQGEYHMFYQSHPYSNEWGPMHWGHAKSKDLLTWERLPFAMAPDQVYDNFGCFSGSALETDDGRHMLLYTGVHTDDDGTMTQTQCLAFGDGENYDKYDRNPIIQPDTLPEGSSSVDFRDPKIWRGEDGIYYAVIAGVMADGNGQIVLYKSRDLYSWEFCNVIEKSSKQQGGVWECPDFFSLGSKYVLVVSPMAMMPGEDGFHPGHITMAIIGEFDKETYWFTKEQRQPLDWGIDYYAPQSMLLPDGRRIAAGWMQSWPNSKFVPVGVKYFGQLSLPRELEIREGKLVQNPIRELLNYRKSSVSYPGIHIADETISLEGVSGRTVDLEITVEELEQLQSIRIKAAQDDTYYSAVSYEPETETFAIDRNNSDYLYDVIHKREFRVPVKDGKLKIRMIMDRFSIEVFINDGEQVASMTIFTPQEADGISFEVKGRAVLDVTCSKLEK